MPISKLEVRGTWIAGLTVLIFGSNNTSLDKIPTPAYYSAYGSCFQLNFSASGIFSSNGTFQAQLRSSGGNQYPIYANSTCSIPAYFKP